MHSTSLERILTCVCLTLIGVIVGMAIVLHKEHTSRVQYEEAACVLSDVCHFSLDDEYLDAPGFEDRYYDVLDNLDCHDMHITREFVEHLSWCY